MNSFAILNTNVGLTSNIKIRINSSYELSLDSIDSNDRLSTSKYKNFKFNKNDLYDELIPSFFKETPIELAYEIKYDNDIDIMYDEFLNQYDTIYSYGAKNIINDKNYVEPFEYFAPIYIGDVLPSNFIIFRVDGPGLISLNKDNFKQEIIKKFKVVKLFDLKPGTSIGDWLKNNFKDNENFPVAPLEVDFRSLEFSKWNGIDFKNGGYSSKSFFMDDIFEIEREIFGLEKFFFDYYKNNDLLFPNILNLSFLFNDIPSTPDLIKKWSVNRYYGFYLNNMYLERKLTPNDLPNVKPDVIIEEGNILKSTSSDNPFLIEWSDEFPFYIEINGNFYIVERIIEDSDIAIQPVLDSQGNTLEEYTQTFKESYKIISDSDLSGKESYINNNKIIIQNNILLDLNKQPYLIENFDFYDVWIIEIDGIYHSLIKDSLGNLKINTDYSINTDDRNYKYRIRGNDTVVETLITFEKDPINFKIFRLNFTDIKDFDTKIVDTDFSKFEYEKDNEITNTDEGKLYFENLNSNENPKTLDDFIYNEEVVNIPTSSEYTSNYETFKISNDELSPIWRINPIYSRWVYKNSLSNNDKPYLLNNSLLLEDFNRTANVLNDEVNRLDRNLDYFYTVNPSNNSYINHSLHVDDYFDFDKYLNIATYSENSEIKNYDFDYFKYFFEKSFGFKNNEINRNVKKYSSFNKGDNVVPNITLFKGIEFRAYDVESIKLDSGQIENINLINNNTFSNYDFSILLTDSNESNFEWEIVEEWEMNKGYGANSLTIYDDILYISNTFSNTEFPTSIVNSNRIKSAPFNLPEWDYYNVPDNIFWNPNTSYSTGDYIYNNNEYYYYDGGTEDFWNPITAMDSGYNLGDVVLYKGNYYYSMTSSNNWTIDKSVGKEQDFSISWKRPNNRFFRPWVATQSSSPKWKPVEVWNPSSIYNNGDLVVYNEILFRVNSTQEAGTIPNQNWDRLWSLEPDRNFIYKENANPIISLNNRFYLCLSNPDNEKLNNGITIYINKKWKNILININFNDNTLPNLSNVDRDLLYDNLYNLLSANNFIDCINNLDNRSGFINNINYIIIKENGDITKHSLNENLTSLKYILTAEYPDEVNIRINSINKKPIETPNSLNAVKVIKDFKINNLSQLNWYNNVPIAAEINEDDTPIRRIQILHGLRNITSESIWRFSGYYMPLFTEIDLFKKAKEFEEIGNWVFDDSLSDFGIYKERKIKKVNRNGSILKLSNDEEVKSIYPMLDEFGVSTDDQFIFKSTWDFEYYVEYKKK